MDYKTYDKIIDLLKEDINNGIDKIVNDTQVLIKMGFQEETLTAMATMLYGLDSYSDMLEKQLSLYDDLITEE